jgi:hypothetical protein
MYFANWFAVVKILELIESHSLEINFICKNNNNSIPINTKDNISKGIKIEKTRLIPLFSNHLQIG